MIFDEYNNKGYVYRAIRKFLDENYKSTKFFQAVVIKKNKNIAIRKLLDKLGFKRVDVSEKDNEIWQYVRR